MPPYEKPKTSYDFITQPPTSSKRPGFGNTRTQRLGLIAGLGVALLVVLFVVISMINRGPNNKEMLLTITQQQTELTRIATFGTKDAAQDTRNIAYTVSVSTTSDRTKLLLALQKHNVTFKEKDMVRGADLSVEQTFKNARAASNFDETFLKTIDTNLAAYQTTLSEAYELTSSEDIRTTLKQAYSNSQLLRTQVKDAQQ